MKQMRQWFLPGPIEDEPDDLPPAVHELMWESFLQALQPLQAGSALMTGEGDGGVPGSVAPAAAQGAAMAPLAAATALQQGSEHPLALAVLRAFAEQTTVTPDEPAAPAIPTAQDVQAIAGHGIQGQLEDGATWYLGSLRWMEQLQPEAVGTDAGETFMKHWLAQGATLSALARQQPGGPVQLQALLAFTDTPKPEAAEAVGKLHAQGLQTVLISGDNRAAAEALARRVGLKPEQGEVQAEVLPADKAYGNTPQSPVGPNQAVVFDVKLISSK